jgi:hypothetical protein
MTEFQRLQHLVRLLADMTEEQRRALADFLNSIGWPPAENVGGATPSSDPNAADIGP